MSLSQTQNHYKPYKGEIHDWIKIDTLYPNPAYGQQHLNYIIMGRPREHPNFSNWIQTSLVVSVMEIPRHRDEEPRYEIETLNSRYILVNEKKDDTSS